MKIFCEKENKFVFIHPNKEEVANFDFHKCSNCPYKCYISYCKYLPYNALIIHLRWVAQNPIDYIYYDTGYIVDAGVFKKMPYEEWQRARLTYSLPSFIGGKMWNKFSNVITKAHLYLTQYKLVNSSCNEEIINNYESIKEKLRVRLLNEAIKEAKQFKHYDPNKPHWANKKLQKEVKRKGIEYEA